VNKNGSSGTKTFNSETDVLDWRIAGGEPDPDTFKKNYRLSRFMPTDGSKALILKMANLFYGHVNVSKDGDYVLAFDATGRMWYDNMQLVLSLVDAAENTNTFACCTIPIGNGYHPFRYLLPRLKAGAYKLLIEALNGKANQTNDSHALLDNFRMTPVFDGLSAVGGVPVPNGSFENTRITSSSRVVTTFGTNDLLCAGWTLTSPGAPAEGAVSPVSRLMKNYYVPNEHDTGVWQLRFHGNTGRATSAAFTLPAGSWTLRCKAAKWAYDGVRWNNYTARNYTPKVGVRVFVNGTQAFDETSGFLEMYEMQTVAFKNVLTVTAVDQVVIEIRQAADKAFMNVDDIEVVPLDAWGSAADLVTDGTFAGGTGNWKTKGDLWHKILNGGYEEHYGGERCDDANALCLKDSAAIWQDLNFPVAGAYRLSFWARSRISHYGTGNAPDTLDFGGNALRASLIVGGVTNTIVETPRVVSTNFNRTVALFTVPSAGKHTLCIAGINDPDAGIWTGGRREDANVLIDCVAVIPAPEAGAAPKLPEDLALKLTGDSKLRLDYVGEATVHKLKIGAKRYHGRVDATVAPGIVTGPGALNVTEPKPGMIFLVR